MNFDHPGEEQFYDFLNDFELTSMIKNIQGQVWINTVGNGRRRIDFVLTLTNGEQIYLEFDGAIHETPKGMESDSIRDYALSKNDIHLTRVRSKDFYNDPEKVANRIEGLIDLLGGTV